MIAKTMYRKSNGEAYSYFVCYGVIKGKCAAKNSVSSLLLEPVVLQALQDVFHTKEITYMKREPTRKQEMVDERKLLSEQLKQLEQKEKRIKAAYQNGIDTLEEYKENKELLRNEQKQLELLLQQLSAFFCRQIFPKKSKPARSFTPSAMCFFPRPFQIHRRTRCSEVSSRKWFMTNRRMSLRFTTISQIRKYCGCRLFQSFACRFHKDDPMGIESARRPGLFPNRNSPLLLR